MAITSRFQFVGNLLIPKDSSARPLVSRIEKNGRKMLILNMGIKSGNSVAYVEGFGSVQDDIRTVDTSGERITVSWDDRFDEEIVESVASYRRHVVDLGEEYGGRKEFLSLYDAIKYLEENVGKYDGKLMITGLFSREWYAKNERYYDHFRIQNVYAVDKATHKDKLALLMDIYYNKDSVDDADFDNDKKIRLNGYIRQYINKDEGEKFLPMQFVMSAAKLDFNNEKHRKIFDYKTKYIYVNNKTIVHIPWDVSYVSGAEEVEFDESMLTENQREQIELGLKTIDDFKPRDRVFGTRITEFRLVDPKLTGEFANGLVDTKVKEREFEEEIYSPSKTESLDDVVSKTKKTKVAPKADVEEDDDIDDLFA